ARGSDRRGSPALLRARCGGGRTGSGSAAGPARQPSYRRIISGPTRMSQARRRLKVYTSPSDRVPDRPHVPMLAPFWGRPAGINPPRPDRLDAYIQSGGDFLELTGLAEADVAVYPLDWSVVVKDGLQERARGFAESARSADTPAVFFYMSDV